MNPKLSIITINLNNIEGLKKTIESVINQLFKDFEYLIVDGGSTDGSLGIIEQNANRLSYWVSETDSGVFQAMNKGIRKAKGEYLLFLNSGDFLLHDHVLSSVFKENSSEDILCGTSIISKNGNVLYYLAPPDKFNLKFFCKRNISHQSTFIKKSLFERFGYYREDYKTQSDYEFWIRTIIMNNCSTRNLNLLISDYNLEGISSKKENSVLSRLENEDIFTHTIPPGISDDYIMWIKEPLKMQVFEWFIFNRFLYLPLLFIYKIALHGVAIKKHVLKMFNK